jgi:hypothetical protein
MKKRHKTKAHDTFGRPTTKEAEENVVRISG